ncbi:thioesterase family protein [Rhodovulum sp. DZ06]|uniref:thioesterase family protein n=1 Tax=Rhodovulum sp. DZ06 TaxID=3425126 RepID=UPI003D32D96F
MEDKPMTAMTAAASSGAGADVEDLSALTALDNMAEAAPLARLIAAGDPKPEAAMIPEFEAKPLRTSAITVPSGWIDYNGHMNVSYYTMAFDKAADQIYDDVLLIGAEYARNLRMGPYVIQQQIHYLGELLRGDEFCVGFRILDFDAKRLHTWCDLIRVSDGRIAASAEALVMNVDLEKRRSTPYPDWAFARIKALAEAQADMPLPLRVGAKIGIRR